MSTKRQLVASFCNAQYLHHNNHNHNHKLICMEEIGTQLFSIGKGQFSTVNCVRLHASTDSCPHRVVAIKRYDRSKLASRSAAIIREKKILMQLQNHKHIVHMYETRKDDAALYFLFAPYLAGSLHEHIIHGSSLPGAAVCRIYAIELISTLYYLATRHIVHRDIKANNILLDDTGHMVLSDFGSAAIATNEESDRALPDIVTITDCSLLPRFLTICGTEEYMAPEMRLLRDSVSESHQNKSLGYNVLVDWYSLGILMYEINYGALCKDVDYSAFAENNAGGYGPYIRHQLEDCLLASYPNLRHGSNMYILVQCNEMIVNLVADNPIDRFGVHSIQRILNHAYFFHNGSLAVNWHAIEESFPASNVQQHLLPMNKAIDFDRRIGWLDMIENNEDIDSENVDQALFESF